MQRLNRCSISGAKAMLATSRVAWMQTIGPMNSRAVLTVWFCSIERRKRDEEKDRSKRRTVTVAATPEKMEKQKERL